MADMQTCHDAGKIARELERKRRQSVRSEQRRAEKMAKKTPEDEYRPPICVWCSHPWDNEMVKVHASTTGGCPTCGYGAQTSGSITITCSNCKRVVYIKEFEDNGR
jgi:hypothetical protein